MPAEQRLLIYYLYIYGWLYERARHNNIFSYTYKDDSMSHVSCRSCYNMLILL